MSGLRPVFAKAHSVPSAGEGMWRDARKRGVRVAPQRQLLVTTLGHGPPLLLLHGFTGSARAMAGLAGRLAARRRVIAVDLPGHGGSDAPADVAAYRMETCVEDLVRVLSACGAPRCDVVGYSMGARVALALAALHPERVSALCGIGARAGIADPEARARRVASDEALADAIEARGLDWFVDHWMGLALFASQARLGPEALERARAERLEARAHGLANSLRGMGAGAQPPLHQRLGDMPPCLLLVGEEDARFRDEAQDLAARMPRARVLPVPAAGHAAHLENPAFTAEAIERFLAALDDPRQGHGTQEVRS